MAGWKKHLERAISVAGSQGRLANLMGCSQSKISWLLVTADEISAEDALGIHHATDGIVPASDIRPDLWASPEHVPPKASRTRERASA